MPHFLVQYWDKPGSGEIRAPNRDAHIAYRRALGAKLVLAGPMFEDFNDTPAVGTMVILDAPDKAAATKTALDDPYYKAFAVILTGTFLRATKTALDDPYYKAGAFKDVKVYAHRILVLNPPPKG